MCCWGWEAVKDPSQDMLGAPACRQALGEKFYFCLDGPTGPSVSIKGPESSPGHLILSTCC